MKKEGKHMINRELLVISVEALEVEHSKAHIIIKTIQIYIKTGVLNKKNKLE
jgi:hypothetical protein